MATPAALGAPSAPGRTWLRQSIATALAIGLALGLYTDIVWPNMVYGYQLLIVPLAILIPIIVLVLPPTRRFALEAIALGVGVVAGIYLGFASQPKPVPALIGSVDVNLTTPVNAHARTTEAICVMAGGKLETLETPENELDMGDGRRLSIDLESPFVGDTGEVPTLEVHIHWTLPDGSPTETVMHPGPGASVVTSGTDLSGSIAFSKLILSPLSEQQQPIDIAGSLHWECPAAAPGA